MARRVKDSKMSDAPDDSQRLKPPPTPRPHHKALFRPESSGSQWITIPPLSPMNPDSTTGRPSRVHSNSSPDDQLLGTPSSPRDLNSRNGLDMTDPNTSLLLASSWSPSPLAVSQSSLAPDSERGRSMLTPPAENPGSAMNANATFGPDESIHSAALAPALAAANGSNGRNGSRRVLMRRSGGTMRRSGSGHSSHGSTTGSDNATGSNTRNSGGHGLSPRPRNATEPGHAKQVHRS